MPLCSSVSQHDAPRTEAERTRKFQLVEKSECVNVREAQDLNLQCVDDSCRSAVTYGVLKL